MKTVIISEEVKKLLKLSPSFNLTHNFGYPITTKYTWLNQSHYDRFFNNVMADMIDLDKTDYNKIEDELKPEVVLKFDPLTEMGKIDIKINRNETLAKERNDI